VENIDFWMDFVVKISQKLQKLGFEGKINWAFNVCTIGPIAHVTLIITYKYCTIWNTSVIRFKLSSRKFFFIFHNLKTIINHIFVKPNTQLVDFINFVVKFVLN
jgi:hypothetical protein